MTLVIHRDDVLEPVWNDICDQLDVDADTTLAVELSVVEITTTLKVKET